MSEASITKLHHKLVAVTAERDALAAELQKLRESENPIAIAADDPAELIEIIRNARRYLALREHGIIADLKQDAEWLFAGRLDAAADRLLGGGE